MSPDRPEPAPRPVGGAGPGLSARVGTATRLLLAGAPAGCAGLLGLAVLGGLLPVLAAWNLKVLLDQLAAGPDADRGRMVVAGVVMAGCGLVGGLLPAFEAYLQSVVRRAMELTVTDRLFRRITAYVGLRRFEDPAFLDRLRLADESGKEVPEQLVRALIALVRGGTLAAGFVVALAVVWPWILLPLAVAAVLVTVLQLRLAADRARVTEDLTPILRRQLFFSALLTDARAAKEVRLFGLGDFLRGRLVGGLRAGHRRERALDRRTLRTSGLLELVEGLLTVLAVGVVAYQAVHGRLGVGDATIFLTGVAGISQAVGSLSVAGAEAYQGLLLFGHYDAVVGGPGEPSPGAFPAAELRRGIELDDVWFRYDPGGPWVLRGVSLRIPAGASVGLVGRNGAGKSTLVKLLCRLYEPSRGTIRWDGVDIRTLDPATLRARVAAVFQDFMAYDLSAAENVGIGRLDALGDEAALRAAAAAAGVDGTLAGLPSGYRTLLSRAFEGEGDEASSLLSGGQWQRVALARAFLRRDADLMILDEPSSGLDAEAEAEIAAATRALRRGRTSLLVSHRLGTLRGCDAIHVLDRGTVVESGTHDALVAAGGTYARLFALQAAGYRDGLVPSS